MKAPVVATFWSLLIAFLFFATSSHGQGLDADCPNLWYQRNLIYKRAGYCFKTTQAIQIFGNTGCTYNNSADIPLAADQRLSIKVLQQSERHRNCPTVVTLAPEQISIFKSLIGSSPQTESPSKSFVASESGTASKPPEHAQSATPSNTMVEADTGISTGQKPLSILDNKPKDGTSILSSQDKIDIVKAIQSQIDPCLVESQVKSFIGPVPILRVNLKADGSLAAEPTTINIGDDPNFNVIANAVIRAIKRCAPFQVPTRFVNAHNEWRALNIEANVHTVSKVSKEEPKRDHRRESGYSLIASSRDLRGDICFYGDQDIAFAALRSTADIVDANWPKNDFKEIVRSNDFEEIVYALRKGFCAAALVYRADLKDFVEALHSESLEVRSIESLITYQEAVNAKESRARLGLDKTDVKARHVRISKVTSPAEDMCTIYLQKLYNYRTTDRYNSNKIKSGEVSVEYYGGDRLDGVFGGKKYEVFVAYVDYYDDLQVTGRKIVPYKFCVLDDNNKVLGLEREMK